MGPLNFLKLHTLKILVTGGCGYIGSHTVVELIQNNFEVDCLDNLSRGNEQILNGVNKICGSHLANHQIDLCDLTETRKYFDQHKPDSIIHFAAFKTVGESVKHPLLYYKNNIESLLNLLTCCDEYGIKHFVFSSSCAVYGNGAKQPVTEVTPFGKAESPYGHTKQICEEILNHFSKTSATKFVILRYFNPAGAHASSLIGEIAFGKPESLISVITQSASGIIPPFTIHGNDYNTSDGTCIRDYVHVTDIARAHTLAINFCAEMQANEKPIPINLGSGKGNSVMEIVKTFEKANHIKLKYSIGERRPGDMDIIYSDNSKAKDLLHWTPQYDLDEMLVSAWRWQQNFKS